MTTRWQPYREPLRVTTLRTGMIAIVGGALLARFWGAMGHWPMSWPKAALLILWPSFGGHWVEVWFLNWLRPRLSITRGVPRLTRMGARRVRFRRHRTGSASAAAVAR